MFEALPDIQFHVTSTEYDPAHPTRPKINFSGELNDYIMKGYVNLTPDDQIRWHFVSRQCVPCLLSYLIVYLWQTSGNNDQMVWRYA